MRHSLHCCYFTLHYATVRLGIVIVIIRNVVPFNTKGYLISEHFVGFEVLTAASMKIAVFWVVAPCSLHLRNVGKLLPDYTAQQPRRQSSS
jgi:hypothetical protein